MRRLAALAFSILFLGLAAAPPSFTVDQILDLPQPDNLIASPVGSTIAWTFNERGLRNIYVADAPDFTPRRLTPYTRRRRPGTDEPVVFERRPDDRVRARRRPRIQPAGRRAQSGRLDRAAEGAGVVGGDCGVRAETAR